MFPRHEQINDLLPFRLSNRFLVSSAFSSASSVSILFKTKMTGLFTKSERYNSNSCNLSNDKGNVAKIGNYSRIAQTT